GTAEEGGTRLPSRAAAGVGDQPREPGQDDDRAEAGERDAARQPAPPHEPVRQEERVPRVAQAHGAAGDEHAERQVEMPRRAGARASPRPAHTRATPSSMTARGPRRSVSRPRGGPRSAEAKNPNEKAPAVTPRPAELVENRREQEREGGPRVDADAHGDERDRDD